MGTPHEPRSGSSTRPIRHHVRHCRRTRVTDVEPGAYAQHVAWQSPEHYRDVVVERALEVWPEPLARHRVNADTFRAYIKVLSLDADYRTGRGIETTNAQALESLGCDKRTVQRCRAAAETYGLYVIVQHGRRLTAAERAQAQRAGHDYQGLANSGALVVPRWLLPYLEPEDNAEQPEPDQPEPVDREAVDNDAGQQQPVDNVTPPSSPPGGRRSAGDHVFVAASAKTAARHQPSDNPPNRSPQPRKPKRRRRHSPNSVGNRLARALVQRVPWLSRTSPGRLAKQLAAYERAGWTADQLVAAMDRVHQRQGWDSPSASAIRSHCGMLKWYLDRIGSDSTRPPVPVRPPLIEVDRRCASAAPRRWASLARANMQAAQSGTMW